MRFESEISEFDIFKVKKIYICNIKYLFYI